MTIMIDRAAVTDTDTDVEIEDDFELDAEPDLDGDFDLELGDMMYGCAEGGYHKDDYVLFEDLYTVTRKCESCGDTWSEDKDD